MARERPIVAPPTLPGARPGPVELKLASLGPVQPLVVGHYGEMGGYVDELLELAADAGADKHWQSMRCRDPDTARGIILQVLLRRSCGGWPPSAKTRASSFAALGAWATRARLRPSGTRSRRTVGSGVYTRTQQSTTGV